MKINKEDTIPYSNGDSLSIYTYDQIQSINELTSIIYQLEQEYGKVGRIRCKGKNSSNESTYIKEYESLIDLFQNFPLESIKSLEVINFSCIDKHVDFTINNKSKRIRVLDVQKQLGTKDYNPEKNHYYRDEDGDIIRYDDNTYKYYILNKETKEWLENQDLFRKFHDSQYTFIPISNEEMEMILNGIHR